MKKLIIGLIAITAIGAGCEQNRILQPEANPDQKVITYLEANIQRPNFGGQVFCEYAKLGRKQYLRHLYIWAICQEYYRQGETFTTGSGVSLAVDLKTDNDGTILGHTAPTDEDYDTGKAFDMFPPEISSQLKTGALSISDDKIISRAKDYFKTNKNGS